MAHSQWKTYGPTLAHGEHESYGKDPYHVIKDRLADLEPFEGHSMWATGEHVTGKVVRVWDDSPAWKWQELPADEWYYSYKVYSYDKQIAQLDLPSERDRREGRDLYRTFWVDRSSRYSPTTSKHQTHVVVHIARNYDRWQLRDVDPTR